MWVSGARAMVDANFPVAITSGLQTLPVRQAGPGFRIRHSDARLNLCEDSGARPVAKQSIAHDNRRCARREIRRFCDHVAHQIAMLHNPNSSVPIDQCQEIGFHNASFLLLQIFWSWESTFRAKFIRALDDHKNWVAMPQRSLRRTDLDRILQNH